MDHLLLLIQELLYYRRTEGKPKDETELSFIALNSFISSKLFFPEVQ